MEIQWPLVFFTLFVGLGCGIFAGSAILTEWYGKVRQIRTHSSIIAIVALAIGGLSSTLHLGHPERIFGALAHPTSGIFMESALIFLLGLTILVYLLALRRNAADLTACGHRQRHLQRLRRKDHPAPGLTGKSIGRTPGS